MEEFYLKLNGKVNIPEKLELGHNYHAILGGSITKEERLDLNNGDFAITAKFEPITCEVLTPKGKTLKAKDKRKMSQKLRGRIFMIWQEGQEQMDFDEYYEKRMKEIITNLV